MAFVVATRGRPHGRHTLRFMWASLRAAFQAQRSPGYIAGALKMCRGLNFLSVTVWEDAKQMQAYRNSGFHAKVMPRSPEWSGAITFAAWRTDDRRRPGWAEIERRFADEGWWPEVADPLESHLKQQFPPDLRRGAVFPLLKLRRARRTALRATAD